MNTTFIQSLISEARSLEGDIREVERIINLVRSSYGEQDLEGDIISKLEKKLLKCYKNIVVNTHDMQYSPTVPTDKSGNYLFGEFTFLEKFSFTNKELYLKLITQPKIGETI